jgi:hypothetical protein
VLDDVLLDNMGTAEEAEGAAELVDSMHGVGRCWDDVRGSEVKSPKLKKRRWRMTGHIVAYTLS